MKAPIIECRGLEKWYSGVHALKNVSLTIAHGEAHFLLRAGTLLD